MMSSRSAQTTPDDGAPDRPAPAPLAFSTRSAASAFWWLLAFGALGGAIAESALILGARVALHRFTLFNPQGIWLAPLANAMLLVVPLGIIWLVARRRGDSWAVAATAFGAAFAATLEPLLVLKDRLHLIAALLLAAGVASQVARFAWSRPSAFMRALRATTVAMVALCMLGGIGFNVARAWRERRAVASLAKAPDDAPNVLLLVLDTVRSLSLSAYGYDRRTSPFLAELAERGARFDRAITTAPWTLPSHATMFTGRYPHELTSGWSTPLDATYPTLAENLTKAGYLTVGVAANLRYCSYEFGLTRGFVRYRDYDVSLSEMWRTSQLTLNVVATINSRLGTWLSPGRQSAARINARLLQLLDGRGDRPFFAFANFYDAHAPYAPPAPFDTLFLGRQPRTRDPGGDAYTPEEVDDLRATYDASIASLDADLRRLFAELDARGLLRNTLVIVTADHGEEFNEHGHMNHGSTLYSPSLLIPLIIVHPGVIPPSRVVQEPVTIRDIPSTILEAVRTADSHSLPGHSLSRWWSTGAALDSVTASPVIAEVDYARNLPAHFAISKGDMKSIVGDGFHYIRRGDGHEELFDLMGDPWERVDVAPDASRAALLMSLRERVRAIPSRASDSR